MIRAKHGDTVKTADPRAKHAGVWKRPLSAWRRVAGTWVKIWAAVNIVVGAQTSNPVGTTGNTRYARILTIEGLQAGNTFSWSITDSEGIATITGSTTSNTLTVVTIISDGTFPNNTEVSATLTITGPDAGTYFATFSLGE